jgi:hypothetical protein
MTRLDIDSLVKALNNETNEQVIETDYKSITQKKKEILQNIGISHEDIKVLLRKLKVYRYIDGAHEIEYGRYIRWISLKDPTQLRLTSGGIVCEIKVETTGIQVVCKNNMNRIFQINLSENLVFQHLTEQERVLLSALQYLNE